MRGMECGSLFCWYFLQSQHGCNWDWRRVESGHTHGAGYNWLMRGLCCGLRQEATRVGNGRTSKGGMHSQGSPLHRTIVNWSVFGWTSNGRTYSRVVLFRQTLPYHPSTGQPLIELWLVVKLQHITVHSGRWRTDEGTLFWCSCQNKSVWGVKNCCLQCIDVILGLILPITCF